MLCPIALIFDVGAVDEAVRLFRRIHIALDVFEFFLGRVRLDRELLHCQRPTDAHDERGEQHQHGRERRDTQIAHHRTREECDGTDDRDDHEDQFRRQHRVDVGVARAGEDLLLALTRQQRISIEPIRHRLEHQEGSREDGQLNTRGVGDRVASATETNAAEEVVGDQAGEEGDHHDHEQDVEHEPIEREVEGVEPDVETELCVALPELGSVQEGLHRGPRPLRDEREDQSDEDRRDDRVPADVAHDRGPVPGQWVIRTARGHENRTRPISQRNGSEDQTAGEDADDQEKRDACPDDRGEHLGVSDVGHPQPVGDDADEPWPHQQHHEDGDTHPDGNLASARQCRHARRPAYAH